MNLYPAKRTQRVALRMLAPSDLPVQRRYFCPREERDIHPEHIIRGFPVETDDYIVVHDDELEALAPEKSRDIDLREFVDIAQVPPAHFERPYFLTPAGDSNKAYRLLAEVMQNTGRAGIATFVMRNKEHLVAILAEGGLLRAETLRFHDELRSPDDVGLPQYQKPPKSRVQGFSQQIEAAACEQLPRDEMVDRYSKQVRQLAARKLQQNEGVLQPEAGDEAPEVDHNDGHGETTDLLETIRRSMQSLSTENDEAAKRKAAAATAASGNSLSRLSKQELYERAKQRGISGRSEMNKQELISALQQGQ